MAALHRWFPLRPWLLVSSGSLGHNGCSAFVFLSWSVASHWRCFCPESWLLGDSVSVLKRGCSVLLVLYRFLAIRRSFRKSGTWRSRAPSAWPCRRSFLRRFRPVFLIAGRTGRLWLWPCRIHRTFVVFCFVLFSFSPPIVCPAHNIWLSLCWRLLPTTGSLSSYGCSGNVFLSLILAAPHGWFTLGLWLLSHAKVVDLWSVRQDFCFPVQDQVTQSGVGELDRT